MSQGVSFILLRLLVFAFFSSNLLLFSAYSHLAGRKFSGLKEGFVTNFFWRMIGRVHRPSRAILSIKLPGLLTQGYIPAFKIKCNQIINDMYRCKHMAYRMTEITTSLPASLPAYLHSQSLPCHAIPSTCLQVKRSINQPGYK